MSRSGFKTVLLAITATALLSACSGGAVQTSTAVLPTSKTMNSGTRAPAARSMPPSLQLPTSLLPNTSQLGNTTQSAQASGYASAAPQSVINCEENIQYPHKSTHVPENVNVVGTITCSAPVSELVLNVGLYYNGVLIAQSGSVTAYGTTFVQANAATRCRNGTYGGGAHGYVYFPPGYEPPVGQLPVVFSPNITITC